MCGCGKTETDKDGDGALDCLDGCPDDGSKVDRGMCGCGKPDTDNDGDGALDCLDGCPDDGFKVNPGICGCGEPDNDCSGSVICGKDCVTAVARVESSYDDAEEVIDPAYECCTEWICKVFGDPYDDVCFPAGHVFFDGPELQLTDAGKDAESQLIGFRFADLKIPPKAVIVDAYVSLVASKSTESGASLDIWLEASDNAATFSNARRNLSLRPRVGASVHWNDAGAWQKDSTYRTPDLSSALAAVADRAGWASGNSVVVLVGGNGNRRAMSYDKSSQKAASLHVTYLQ